MRGDEVEWEESQKTLYLVFLFRFGQLPPPHPGGLGVRFGGRRDTGPFFTDPVVSQDTPIPSTPWHFLLYLVTS